MPTCSTANGRDSPVLCGSVLHTQPAGFHRTREPIQIGAELYGHAGIESDLEIQHADAAGPCRCGVQDACSSTSATSAVYRALAQEAGLSGEVEHQLFGALQAKDSSAVAVLDRGLAHAALRDAFAALPQLYGDRSVLAEARARLPQLAAVRSRTGYPGGARPAGLANVEAAFDLAELRGYHYHSGVVFAAYTGGRSHAIAQGGRYDEVGRVFGRARPATGFSLDLRELAHCQFRCQ